MYYNNTTDSFPCTVAFPGEGEASTDSSQADINGPIQYIRSSKHWNGTVNLGTVTHYPILINLQPNAPYRVPTEIKGFIDIIMANFRVLRRKPSLSLAGPSMGGWESTQFAAEKVTSTDSTFAQMLASVVDIEGVKPDDQYNATPAYPGKFTTPANCGVKLWGFEQSNDGRDINTVVTTWNGAKPGSAQYQQTTYGSTGHGFFNYLMGGFLDGSHGGDNTTQDPAVWSWNGTSENIYQFMIRSGDTVDDYHYDSTLVSPVAHAGGTVYVTEPVKTVALNGSGSTGNNLKYRWRYFPGYYANNSGTLTANLFGESSFDNLKQYTYDTAIVTQIFLGTDSVHKYGYILTVTDSVSGLTSTDTAYVVYRCRTDYPPQNIDGSKGFHYWGTNPSYDNVHFPGGIVNDVVITGANQDPVNNASGVPQNMSFYVYPTQSDTFHIFQDGQTHTVWMTPGHYRTYAIHGDTLGGTGMQLLGTLAHPFQITTWGGYVRTDLGFQLSNPMYYNLTGKYDAVKKTGSPFFAGHDASYSYRMGTYALQFLGENSYIGTTCAGIDGLTTRNGEMQYIEFGDGHAEGLVMKQDTITGHPQIKWVYMSLHDCYFHNVFQEASYNATSTSTFMTVDSSKFYNNTFSICGDKALKIIGLGSYNYIHNNVAIGGGQNGLTAFEPNVCWIGEFGLRGDSNTIRGQIYDAMGGYDQVLNILKIGPPVAGYRGIPSRIVNTWVGDGHGYTGVFMGGPYVNGAVKYTINFDSCYFGRFGPFDGSKVYTTGTPATNSNYVISAQQGGSVTDGGEDTVNVTNSTYDSSKYTLYAPGSIYQRSSGNTLVKTIPAPVYVNAWFTPGSRIRFWCDTIYKTYRNEFANPGGSKPGTLYAFSAGDTCYYFGDLYISRQNNNIGHVPQQRSDQWWTYVQYANGGYIRPDDVRLFTTDPLALRGIGLLDQISPGASIPNMTNTQVKVLFH